MLRLLITGVVTFGLVSAVQAGATDFFSEKEKDFGTTPRGPVLVHYFTVKNTSSYTISLGQPRVSCGCVSADIAGKAQLAPGESAAVRTMMDTRRIPQANILKTVIVYVPVSSPTFEEVQLRVMAIARDDLVMSPDVLAFGTLRKGQSGTVTTKVTFYSDPNWTVSEAKSTGAYVKTTLKRLPQQAASGVSYEVTATLDSNCPVGDWTADIWLKTTSLSVEKIRIPVRVTVISPIAVNPEAVKFEEGKVGEPSEQKVILQGNQPFKILEIKGQDDDVKIENVASGARPVHILKVVLVRKEAGTLAKSLIVITDHKEQPEVVVPLTGVTK